MGSAIISAEKLRKTRVRQTAIGWQTSDEYTPDLTRGARMTSRTLLALVLVAQTAAPLPKGVRLDRLTWPEAQAALRPETIVLIPLGSGATEHGPHLKLGTDLVLAEYLARRVADAAAVVVAPTLTYHHYPAFAEYPGSASLALATARDLTADVVRSLAAFGPRRFYVLNTGISTAAALEPAAASLAGRGILLRYTDVTSSVGYASRTVRKQDGGNHADEVETSMMLHIDPAAVKMSEAVRDFSPPSQPFRLTRSKQDPGTYSPTGIWGDASLATKQKGVVIADRLVESILEDIERLRTAPLPTPVVEAAATRPAPSPAPRPSVTSPGSCTPGDERAIRVIGEVFSVSWTNLDFEKLAALWAGQGDIVHPDGWIERTRDVILQNRRELFARREYRQSRHPLTLNMVRCVSPDVAVADGKWELRGVFDANGKSLPRMEGLASLTVKRAGGGGWLIEAYRYSITAPVATVPPSILKRPGYPGGQE
jgi:creatinine amidohydrolase